MKIKSAHFVPTQGAFFFDDQQAIVKGAPKDGFIYDAEPQTYGFTSIRMPAEAISVMLVLEDGQVAVGDCCAVQYPGVGGRDTALNYLSLKHELEHFLLPKIIGLDVTSYIEAFNDLEKSSDLKSRFPLAIRYGLSQALLNAVSLAKKCPMAEILSKEYELKSTFNPVRIFAQSGEDVKVSVDKMILRGIDVLPHGLINNVQTKVGEKGVKFRQLLKWIKSRIIKLRPTEDYKPELHFDTYGTIGLAFDNDLKEIAKFLKEAEGDVAPFQLRIEHPIEAGSQKKQIQQMALLRKHLKDIGSTVQIVADEWCGTLDDFKRFADAGAADMLHIKLPDLGSIHEAIEAVNICKQAGILSYIGGSCTETDISARISAHLALATQPHQVLAKPGMGVDEGHSIIANEMARTQKLLELSKW